MKKKILYIFSLALLILGKGFAQTKIFLKPPNENFEDFTFINTSDSIFLKFEHSEDMGHKYSHRYSLKTNVPDGKYEVYVNDTLDLKGYVKNFEKDSIWTTYYKNGNIRSIKPYKKGEIDGEMKRYYNNGILSYRGIISKGKAVDSTFSFYETGSMKAKNYFENGVLAKQEVFEESGELKLVYYPPNTKKRNE